MRKAFAALAGALALCALAPLGAARAQQDVVSCAEGISAQGAKSAGCLIQPQATATAAEGSHVFKSTGQATLVDFQVNSGATAVWVMVLDAAVAPTGSGAAIAGCTTATTARPCVAKWYQLAINSTLNVTWAPGPFPQLQTGLVLACSSTGPFTITYSTTCTFSAEAM
jgi:hypothetical protein